MLWRASAQLQLMSLLLTFWLNFMKVTSTSTIAQLQRRKYSLCGWAYNIAEARDVNS